MRAGHLAAAALLALAPAGPAGAEEPGDLKAALHHALYPFRERHGFPGTTAAILVPDGTAVTAATGLAAVEAGRAMTPRTPMLAASIGKPFVAATVPAREGEGRLPRDDRVSDHLGDRSWFGELPNAASMTVGHLLRHEAGLPDHPHMAAFQEAAAGRMAAGGPAFTPEEILAFVAGASRSLPPARTGPTATRHTSS
jgi:D-alanyl-D-alanine carboxypeptidase